ncbi:hypothetical protein BZZ01_09635 [Nostocales cyanobacterium HT-58-2]|nr:hypothetical protein BZZ01_09635 [Nostocales cyanobacterium HT-58-2]
MDTQKVTTGYQLSPQQEHLWLLQQVDQSLAYHSQCAILIEGNLSINILKAALENVINRHEILRTSFHCLPEMNIPIQVIADKHLLSIHHYDLSCLETQEQQVRIATLLSEANQQFLNFTRSSSLHTSLITLSVHKYLLLLSLPALCADTVTLKNLMTAISHSYAECLHNKEVSDLPIQYIIISEWQNELLESEDGEIGSEYWQKQDISNIFNLKLACENQSFGNLRFEPQFLALQVTPEKLSKLQAIVARHETTIPVFLLSCWLILLWQLIEHSDIVVGTACNGRTDEDLEEVLGLLAKYLPIHYHLEENILFSELLKHVQKATQEIDKWQECFSWKQIRENINHTTEIDFPFLPFCFDFEKYPTPYSIENVTFSIHKLYSCIDKFKLKLLCVEQDNCLNLEFHYDSNLFCREDINCIARQFHTLLVNALNSPDVAIAELKILGDAEKQQLLVEFNNTKTSDFSNKCIHQLIEEQVEKTPDAIAVVFEPEQLTYRELNARANQLAHYLQTLGVGPEVHVGICAERSVEMLVGLLGILKAGGVYVPLDPAYPQQRLALMLNDAPVPVVLTQQRLVETLANHSAQLVCLDSDWAAITTYSTQNFTTEVSIENLAYTIYTSGSTGTPKGVMISHQALCNHMLWMRTTWPLTTADKVLHKTSISFDASGWELYAPLIAGAQLVMAQPQGHKDSVYLVEAITQHEITILQLVPSMLQMLLTQPTLEKCRCLRSVYCGGEPLPLELYKSFASRLDAQLYNLYGPTETCIDVTSWTCESKSQRQTVPIGRPITNTQIYILDSHLQLVPIGVPGELYIGGVPLARGYLNNPELTAEKFIPNPFSQEDGARLYKTGDQARYSADGNIEFLTRLDQQVKIRGFRIELGEIEAALVQNPQVQQAVVMARQDQPGQKRLVAYIVSNQEHTPTTIELRHFLAQKLPEFMVPSGFVFLEELPLSPNGKIDRKMLPAPEHSRSDLDVGFVGPRTPTEEVVAAIWAKVLGVKQVGIHDNFFDLGGHSLLATQVVSQVRKSLLAELPLRSLFEHSTVARLSEHIDATCGEHQNQPLPPIKPVPRDANLPLSFAQQRLWFLYQLETDSVSYNIPAAVRLDGLLDVAALKMALQEIVRRHEVLRTTFSVADGHPVQVIAPEPTFLFSLIDLGQLSQEQQSVQVQHLATNQAQQPFDLNNGPLLRVMVLHLSQKAHILLLTMHHIISDAWSTGVLVRELTTLYSTFTEGKTSPLPELPIQYADFAVWQRQWLQGEVLETQLNYWKQKLTGAPPVLELPSDRPRPAIQTYRGATQSLLLSLDLSQALHELSQRENATLFMTLLAAFNVLLYRYTGQNDILVGTDIANRNLNEIEGLIGFFVNQLVLRTDLSGNPTFQDLLIQVRKVALEAYAHQNLAFEKLVEVFNPERHLSYSPLFQVKFVLQNTPVQALELPGLALSPVEVNVNTAKFDLTLSLQETEQGIEGVLEYNTDLFDDTTITRLLEHLRTLLEDIIAHPTKRLSDFCLLSKAEQHQLLIEWNDTQAEYPQDRCIHQLFEAQVERTPNAVAIVFEDQQLTYQELNIRANQLAHYLQSLGVGPEVLVGICVERSLEMVIGLLGILKAGGAYVPLDARYPLERLAFMLEDSQVPVLLTQQHLVEELPTYWTHLVCLDTDWAVIAQATQNNPINRAIPENLAYVIYTSGSTGNPKGTLINHRGLINYLTWCLQGYSVEVGQGTPVHSSICFDLTITGLFTPLLVGRQVQLLPEDVNGENLCAALRKGQNFSLVKITPAHLQLLNLQLSPQEILNSTRALIIGGENLLAANLSFWQEFSPNTTLVNEYGPTETVVGCCVYQVPANSSKVGSVPIGRPIANTQIYILDSHLQLVPIGVSGELYIGGVPLARGYLNNPELTAEKFIPNPFSQEDGARLYKTGDQARYSADGNIEFLTRLDQQVKIRGFRIELGEIEAALVQNPQVQQAVVMARQDQPGQKRLVAYIVSNQEHTPTTIELRHFLAQKLPEFMVPSAFIFLNALPLTSNGKINYRALPAPEHSGSDLDVGFVGPRTPTEEVVAAIWAKVLGVKQVGIHDNFFDLGGHSLLATQVVSQVRKSLLAELPLRSLFEHSTVARLSEHIDATCGEHQNQPLPPIKPVPRDANLPLSFAQQRLWFLYQLETDSVSYNIPAAVRLDGLLDVAALKMALQEIVRRHEVLRTTFSVADGHPVQVIAPEPTFLFSLIDLGQLSQEQQSVQVQHLATNQAQQPFDLNNGPLLRVMVLHLSQKAHILLLTMHHIISDAWSTGVLVRELTTLYSTFTEGKTSPLPELPIQYADFAVWQRQWLQGEVLETQLNYWKQKLTGAPPVLELPSDRPRPAIQTYRGATQSLLLSLDLSQALHELSQRENATLFMTLLAAFNVLLYRYTGQNDIVLGSPIAGRNHAEIEALIGFFLNTLVLRVDVSGNPSFQELLTRVREVALEAYTHQDLPFEKLVEEIQPERNLSYTPLFQIMFVLQNAPISDLELSNLKLTPVDINTRTVKLDLNFHWIETNQGLLGIVNYNTDLFNDTTISRLLKHFQTLLENIVSHPEKQISTLSLLTETERHYLSVCRNSIHPVKSFTEFQKEEIEQSITTRFEQQVKLYPQNLAVKSKHFEWTYSQLNQVANSIAQIILRQYGIAEERIALLFEHDAPMIAALLGVLKAGKTYVPLDPNYPLQRLNYILQDSQVSAILTNNKNLAYAQELSQDTFVIINLDDIDLVDFFNDIKLPKSLDAIAYILYTSGSTGQPKGVMQNHRNVLHFIQCYTNNLHISANDKLTLLSSYSFDAAVMDIFGSLLNGATLYLFDVKEEGLLNLSQWLIQQEITIYHSTPTVYRHFLNTLNGTEQFSEIRLLVLGGEEVYKKDVDLYKKYFSPECIFVNGLGPTESTVSLQYFINKQTEITKNAVPVGYPVEETEILLLNESGEETEVYGEIAIKSAYVALGYWQKPKITRAVFLPDPKGGNKRIYRTGDMGRLMPDGSIEFMGRKDFQVKLRGFRIELGEVEAALSQHLTVKESVITACEDNSGYKSLVAYVVLNQEHTVATADLRHFLQAKLPDYMVPSTFVQLDALPLTPSGKVDRRSLPKPDQASQDLGVSETFVAPKTPLEDMLADIWAEVLKLERVSVSQNFFELGGHSLLATQVMSRIRDTFHVELPLRRLFEHPTLAELAESIETEQRTDLGLQAPPILNISREKNLSLSFAQQRLWFLDQLEPSNSFYNIHTALRLKGTLNVAALEQSFNELVHRHEVLRTNFLTVKGQPVQAIAPQLTLSLPILNLQLLPKVQQQAEVLRLATQEAQQPFDLAQGSLLRAKLLKLNSEEHVFLLTMHHIVSDGWSMGILVRELAILYQAFCDGSASPLPPLPIQYADFAAWQRQWLEGEVLESQLSYWKQQLDKIPPILQLPSNRPRPLVQTYRGARKTLALSPRLSEALKALSRKENVTLFMTMLTAFKVLLYRYTGQEDIVVGSPIAGRNRREIEELIGFFVNTLVLRTNLSGNPSFRELLRRVREVTLGAYVHQDLPFEKLVEELQPERNLSYTPLFQVMFSLQNAPIQQLETSNLTLSTLEVNNQTAKFDLTVDLAETPEGLYGNIEYNIDLFDSATITQMLGHFQNLLERIVAAPEQSLADLPLLTEAEHHQLLAEWNHPVIDYPDQVCIHQLFEAQVAQTPDAVAVVHKDQCLTYSQLNSRANQLAHYLHSLGVKPDHRVGLCIDTSFEMVVAMLAILKAGAAYIPLDSAYPPERLAFMLADAQVLVLLTQQHLVDRLPQHSAQFICLDTDWHNFSLYNRDNLNTDVTADNLAYVIYTSGSTGNPKGVLVEHRSLVNYTFAIIQALGIQASDRMPQLASLSFDVTLEELLPVWLSGATVVLPEQRWLGTIADLEQLIQTHQLTTLEMTTAYWHEWVYQLCATQKRPPDCLRFVLMGGEQVLPERVASWQEFNIPLVHVYGLTETTITSLVYKLTPGLQQQLVQLPLGRPLANTQVYILDQHLQLLPIGVPGELYIGGDGLTRGYFNRPDLTAEKFLPNPWSAQVGARLYRTGDLARYSSQGNIEFLGRIDQQVKLRGFRVEVGEIEALLAQHPLVRDNVVLLREDVPGDKRLVAYVIAEQQSSPSTHQLRQFLQQLLPDYMLPSAFVFVQALPLTPNGKIDRPALPVPDSIRPQLEEILVLPQTATQEVVAEVWQQVLSLEQIGIHDNFFELGGHSLLAIQVISRIREIFQVELPLRSLFEEPTVEALVNAMIHIWGDPEIVEEIAMAFKELKQLSEDEVKILLLESTNNEQ